MLWIKKTAIGTGIILGTIAAATVMLPTSHRTEAAVAVIDQQNIAEAIKTAINTATILTTEEKELALQILNMKKIDIEKAATIVMQNEIKKQQVWNERNDMTGILDKNDPVAESWGERLGDLDKVINGHETVYDAVKREQKRQKALDETSKSAAQAAENTLKNSQDTLESVNDAVEISNNAEGQLQATQAGNAIMAINAYSIENGNRLLSNITAMMAVQYQQENLRRAESEKVIENSRKMSSEWLDHATVQK